MTTTQASTGRYRLLDALEQGEMDTVFVKPIASYVVKTRRALMMHRLFCQETVI